MDDSSKEFDWSKNTWDICDKAFKDDDFLILNQIGSFNNLISDTIPRMIQHHPIKIKQNNTSDGNHYYELKFLRTYVSKPVQHINNEGYQPLYPHNSRMCDLTYSGPVFTDYEITYKTGPDVVRHIEEKIPLFKIPIMVGSNYCHLYGKTPAERVALNECEYDRGGYFIINGSEKVVIAQERPVDNRIMLFKENTNHPSRAEIKSTLDQRFYPIKISTIYYSKSKSDSKTKKSDDHVPGNKLEVGIPHINKPKSRNGIPLFIVFRALGVISDRSILELILGDLDVADNKMVNLLLPSVHESSFISTQLEAIQYIAQFVNYKPPTGKTEEESDDGKLKYTKDIINREFISHIGQDNTKKTIFLACMTRKLLKAIINPKLFSDRDHYSNKRVDLTGPLLAQIIRYHFQRLIRDIKQVFVKELAVEKSPDGISREVRKIIQKCNIESKLKYALSTGNWHTSHAHANSESKKGIAQVLQRLSYIGMLSHCRRVQSPLERAGSKHEPPRRYHATQIGKICMNETPEGQQVGTVKNLALLCHVSIECSSYPVRYILSQIGVQNICEANPKVINRSTNVFVNGDLVGIIDDPKKTTKILKMLRMFKLNGKISKYTSISWQIEQNELLVYTDGGRYCRPLYIVDEANHFKLDSWVAEGEFDEQLKELDWETLFRGRPTTEITEQSGAVLEYIDTNEEEASMLAIFPYQLIPGKLHLFSDDETETNLVLGYPESAFNITEACKDSDKDKNIAAVTQHIRKNLPTKLQEHWDKVRVTDILDLKWNKIRVKMPKSDRLTRFLVRNLNRFLYKEYLVYTHCEIHPAMWHSVVAQMIPFPDHNQSPRNCYQSSMGKQALGTYATNYKIRTDTMGNVLTYPQRPLVQPRTVKYTKMDEMPSGYQAIVAIACYSGYNQEDSVLVNKGALEAGMFNSLYFRTYTNKLLKHKTANTCMESYGIPPQHKTRARRVGTGTRNRYHAINSQGHPRLGSYVESDDILISKYKIIDGDLYDDASTLVKEPGIVDFVIPNEHYNGIHGKIKNENAEGNTFVKARVCNLRKPIIGDKLASRSAQKGTIGMIYAPEDMPMTKDGLIPDIIMNPHAMPSRMTISQFIESVLGKAALLSGRTRDATPFTSFNLDSVKEELRDYGFDHNGDEVMYNGMTGEMFKVAIFINPTYYQRLKHMVADKIHSRDLGPVQLLTRQPAEGRSRSGGLRIGEMERDCFIAHGITMYQKEKMNESSDIFRVWVSKNKGTIVNANPDQGIYKYGLEDIYEDDEIVPINIPFAQSLLLNELRAMFIDTVLEV